jgi:hypothetical protein
VGNNTFKRNTNYSLRKKIKKPSYELVEIARSDPMRSKMFSKSEDFKRKQRKESRWL